MNSANVLGRLPSLWFYRAMSQGIKGHQDQERMTKIEERKRDERLRRYHKDILAVPDNDSQTSTVTLPPIIDCDTVYYARHACTL